MSDLGTQPRSARRWLEIGDLAALLDDDARQRLLVESGVPVLRSEATYIRLKPGTGALVGLELWLQTPTGELQLPGYVRTHTAERAAELVRKWHAGRTVPTPVGDGVRLLAGGCSVLFLFPNDARVQGLRFVADVDKLKRTLAGIDAIGGGGWRIRGRKTVVETVRYKPERRLILRARLEQKQDQTGATRSRDVFIRFFADDRGETIARFRQALVSQPVDRHLPPLLGVAEGGRLFVEQAVAGGELLPHVLAGSADAGAVADLLSELHGSVVDGLPAVRADEVLATARASARNLMRVEPAFDGLLLPVLARLAELLPAEWGTATLHGDCHLHQFLNGADGPVLVDFERMAQGHPLFDLGHLVAHLTILAGKQPAAAPAIQAFRDALVRRYAERNPDVDMAALPFFTGCGLLERALLPFRRVRAEWRRECRELLEQTATVVGAALDGPAVERAEPWEVVVPRPGDEWPGWILDGETRCFGSYDRSLGRFVRSEPAADAALPGLAGWLAQGELLNYRHGRRAILRVGEDRFVKVIRPRKAIALAQRCADVEAAAAGAPTGFPVVPRLLESDPAAGVLVFDRVPGESLYDRCQRGVEDLDAAARGLVAFHRLAVPPECWPQAHQHASPTTWAGFVADFDPGLYELCAALFDDLDAAAVDPIGPGDRLVHGDLHDKNLLLDGDRLGIIDLDQVGVGNPALDVGNLAAHLVLRALQAEMPVRAGRERARRFLAAYTGHGGDVDAGAVMAVGAHTLFRLACLYRFRRQWCHLCRDLLAEVPVWLDRAGPEGDL